MKINFQFETSETEDKKIKQLSMQQLPYLDSTKLSLIVMILMLITINRLL